jgi:hypothetical protein
VLYSRVSISQFRDRRETSLAWSRFKTIVEVCGLIGAHVDVAIALFLLQGSLGIRIVVCSTCSHVAHWRWLTSCVATDITTFRPIGVNSCRLRQMLMKSFRNVLKNPQLIIMTLLLCGTFRHCVALIMLSTRVIGIVKVTTSSEITFHHICYRRPL